MIDNNIIKSLGAGSGIDIQSMVKQLTEIEGSARQTRIDSAREKTEAKISDYGLLKSSLATMQTSLKALTAPEGLFSKSASFTESDAIVPEKLGTDVTTGTYSLEVLETAQAQSLSSAVFTDPSDAVGKGTLTFRFGDWAADLSTFAVNADKEGATITINDTNNSLTGLRDAINKADFGVQASIVNDGTGYRLLMTAPSGASHELEIQVAENETTPTNTDAAGLSVFAFNETGKQLTNTQSGRDAQIKVNGLTVTRSTNLIDDVIQGFSFSAVKKAPGEIVNVTISDDKAFAEQKIRDFVDAYNTFFDEVKPLYAYQNKVKNEEGEEVNKPGSLANDSMAKSILSQLRTTVSNAIPGLSGGEFSALTNVGIRTERDGSISIDEEDFRAAMDNNFEAVQKLFAPNTSSTASDIEVNGYQDRTLPGTYDVNITQAPRKGNFVGGLSSVPLDTTGKVYSFQIKVDSTLSATISLPADKIYTSYDEMANELQTLINADSNLKSKNAAVTVSYDTDHFVFTSKQYGSKSQISFSGPSADFQTDFGVDTGTATGGQDVKGTVDGVAGFGVGNVLLPDLKSDASGLSLIIGENATTGSVSYSRGFGGELSALIDRFQKADGIISARTNTLEDRLESLDEDQERHDRRMSAFQERMMQQFISMENILNGLSSTGGFLENLVDTLPFTAKK
jgi:flagellar hook-associated protein 2